MRVPGRVLGWAVVPFVAPALLALALGLTTSWPREIAPGLGLKHAGLAATLALVAPSYWMGAGRSDDQRVRRLAAVLTFMVGLLAWPIWSAAVLPLVNGARLQDLRTVEMTVERVEATTVRRSCGLHHWAWLVPPDGEDGLARGRVFIDPATYERLEPTVPAAVAVDLATGLLGANVVLAVR